ncbi:MAG: hypothetical protein K8M05_13240, partial [Deltaproteobacteria bacterium]|nr:hypothetical protein [Kofleriaceae bacterium]
MTVLPLRDRREHRLARDVVEHDGVAGAVPGLALLADQLLQVLDHRVEELLQLLELRLRGRRRLERGRPLAAPGDRQELIERGLRLGAQGLGLAVQLLALLRRLGVLGLRRLAVGPDIRRRRLRQLGDQLLHAHDALAVARG